MKSDTVSLIFCGDFVPVNIYPNADVDIDDELLNLIAGSDAAYLNLEAPITDYDNKRMKAGSNLKIDQSHIRLLKKLNIEGVSLCNNHIFDFGLQGVEDTINSLNNIGIKYWGVGSNKKKAWEPFIVEKKGIRIAIISYAEHEFNWENDYQWCTSLLEPGSNILQVNELRKLYDYVIVFTHIGPENWHYPSPRQVNLFRNFVDAGASLVLNSHSHTIMGMERYKNSPIYYSLGNFFFPGNDYKKSWYNGLLVKIELPVDLSNRKIKTNEIPITFSSTSLEISDRNVLMSKLSHYSNILNDDIEIKRKWDEFGKQEQKKLLKEVIKALGAIALGFILQPISNKFRIIKQKGWAIFRNYATCENHVENIGNIFINKLNSRQK
jgi:poly-gamma-glutamate synthesis protein (capsule biosynthesis protein)